MQEPACCPRPSGVLKRSAQHGSSSLQFLQSVAPRDEDNRKVRRVLASDESETPLVSNVSANVVPPVLMPTGSVTLEQVNDIQRFAKSLPKAGNGRSTQGSAYFYTTELISAIISFFFSVLFFQWTPESFLQPPASQRFVQVSRGSVGTDETIDDSRSLLGPKGFVVVRRAFDPATLRKIMAFRILEALKLTMMRVIFNESILEETNTANAKRIIIDVLYKHIKPITILVPFHLILQAAAMDALGRGLITAEHSLIRPSIIGSAIGCLRQLFHYDFTQEFLSTQTVLPYSLIVSLMDGGCLCVPVLDEDGKMTSPPQYNDIILNAGDYVIFGPRFPHAGAPNLHGPGTHWRLFSYLGAEGTHIPDETEYVPGQGV